MNTLISIINKLQNVFHTVGEETLLLPQIVAVGGQSSGKSSVIENILGKSFLPKGVGIITRQPLILQLINIPESDNSVLDEFGVFQHKKNVIFKDFNEIRQEIETETNNKVGRNKEISEEPICLSIYSRNVVNLTLIDLPGLTKIPVGNQPPDIEVRIRKLITRYISNPNSIILAVVTANTDMTTSESLKLAREFDPDGDRTVAVVTKLDLMDPGTDATDILTGRIIPVKLGIVGVVNRSQRDTLVNKAISDAIRDEAAFLQKNYPSIANKNGTPYLSRILSDILKRHIKRCLPDLKLRMSNVKAQTMARLQFFGEDSANGNKALLHVITAFCSSYCAALDGTSRQIETTKLSGGARICYIFHETFGKTLTHVQPLVGLSKFDILTVMRNSSGTRPSLFVPEACFEILVKKQIARLLQPSLKCAQIIHDEMQDILQASWSEATGEMIRFPKLFNRIIGISSDMIRRRLSETNAMVESLIDIELAYINTMHPDFRSGADVNLLLYSKQNVKADKLDAERKSHKSRDATPSKSVQSVSPLPPCSPTQSSPLTTPPFPTHSQTVVDNMNILSLGGWFASFLPVSYISKTIMPCTIQQTRSSVKMTSHPIGRIGAVQALSDRDELECEVIEKLVSSYFNIIKKSIQDKIPKVIMHCLVNYVKDNLQRELVEVLYKTEQDESLLEEPEQIKIHREEQKCILKTLEDVDALLNEVRGSVM